MNNQTLQDKYASNGFGRIGNSFSQLGHAFAWGAGDVSISGKTGCNNFSEGANPSKLWKFNLWMVDTAFRLIDGKDHCKRAYLVDKRERYDVGRGLYQDIVCTTFILIVCPVITIFTYFIQLCRFVKRKFEKWLQSPQ